MIKKCTKWGVILQFTSGLIVGTIVMYLFFKLSPTLDHWSCFAAIASAIAAAASFGVALKNSKLNHDLADRASKERSKELMYLVVKSSAAFLSFFLEVNELFISWLGVLEGDEEPEVSFVSFQDKLPRDVDWKLFDNELMEKVLTFEFYLSVKEASLMLEEPKTQEERVLNALQHLEVLVTVANYSNELMKKIRSVGGFPWKHQKHFEDMIENMNNQYLDCMKTDSSSHEFDS